MKKIITLLLVLVLSFSFFAGCKKKNNESTSKPSTSESAPESSLNQEGTVTNADLSNALSNQFNEVASAKIEVDLAFVSEENEWYYDGETYCNDNYYNDSIGKIVATVSNDENGIDAKVTISSKHRNEKDEEYQEEPAQEMIYVIDNTVYLFMGNAFVINYEATEAVSQLASLSMGEILSTDEQTQLFNLFGEYLNVVFDIKNYMGSFELNLKPLYDEVAGYVNGLDFETKTVESLINDLLKIVDESLTVESILSEVEDLADLTVNEAVAEIDAYLTENYQTTLQGLYDKIVADERIMAVIVAMAQSESDETDPEELIAQIKALKIADLITANEIGDVTLFDLFVAYMGSAEEAPTKDQLLTMINDMLDLSLADYEANTENYVFTRIKNIISAIEINVLNEKLDVKFTNGFAVENLTYAYNLDYVLTTPSGKEGEEDVQKLKLELNAKVTDLSTTHIQVEKATDVEFYDFSAIGEWYIEDEAYGDLWVKNGYIYFYIYNEDGVLARIYYSFDDIAIVCDETIIINVEDADIDYYEYGYEVNAERIIITVDPVTGMATIEMQ